MNKELYLNLGGLRGERANHWKTVNLDDDADIIHDLNVIPWPFKNDSVDAIYCSNTLEHLTADLDKIMREVKRILRPYGIATFIFPNFMFINYRVQYLLGQPNNYNHGGHNKTLVFDYVKYAGLNAGLKPMLEKWHFIHCRFYKRHIKLDFKKII